MIAAVINGIGIIIAGFLGSFFGKKISISMKDTLMHAVCLIVGLIGIKGALETKNIVILILSIFIGSVIGELLDIDSSLNKFGKYIESKFKADGDRPFSIGFINGSLIFCMGAMSIVGSFEAGLEANYTTLYAKTAIDIVAAIVLSSTLGIGIAFSGITVFIYQTFFILLAGLIQPLLTVAMINEVSAVGSLLIVALSLNLLNLTNIKTGNLMPAILMPIFLYSIGIF